MPSLETPDGKAVEIDAEEINRQFAEALNADDTPAEQAPPKRQPREPKAETPRAPRARRTPKAEKARTAAAPVPEATPEVTAKRAKNAAETIEIVGGALSLLGTSLKSPAFKADGYVLRHVAPRFGAAAAEVARHDATVARWLDKPGGGKVAAYAGAFACVASLGAQLAVNHGVLKPGVMGAIPAEEIIRAFEPEEPAAAAEAADVPAAS